MEDLIESILELTHYIEYEMYQQRYNKGYERFMNLITILSKNPSFLIEYAILTPFNMAIDTLERKDAILLVEILMYELDPILNKILKDYKVNHEL